MLMVILQNAYFKDETIDENYVPTFERESFAKSVTGIRLRKAIPEWIEHRIINASPQIGDSPDSYFPPDPEYCKRMYDEIKPDVILACGLAARAAIAPLETDVEVIYMPHPAYRALKNKTLEEVNRLIEQFYKDNQWRKIMNGEPAFT